MEKKIVSVRLEESEHEYFKKRARQEGMTFTSFVSKSMYHFDSFLKEKKSSVVNSAKNETALYAKVEDTAKYLTDFPVDETQGISDRDQEILRIDQTLQSLTEKFLNEKSRHEDIAEQIAKLEGRLKKIQSEKVTSKQTKVSRNSGVI